MCIHMCVVCLILQKADRSPRISTNYGSAKEAREKYKWQSTPKVQVHAQKKTYFLWMKFTKMFRLIYEERDNDSAVAKEGGR